MRLLAVVVVLFLLVPPDGASATPPADVEAIQDRVIEAVNADWANFGGVYLEKDGTLVIQYIGANAGRAAVEEALEPGVSVRWQEVERSRADLMGMKREIRDRNLDGVVGVGIDTINNQVEVTVSPSEHFEEVSSAANYLFGDGVTVIATDDPPVADICSSRTSCTRWRGGIRIDRNNGSGYCTWGFQASRNGNLQMITAGHCHETGGKFNHNGETIGSNGVGRNAIDPATFGTLDVSRTRVTGANYPVYQNRLYATEAYKSWSLTSVKAYSGFAVGQAVGKSGISTHYSSGYITDIDYDYRLIPPQGGGSLVHYPNCTFETRSTCPWVWGAKADYAAAGGDSGSPVYSAFPYNNPPMGDKLFGIHSAGNPSISVFAPASAAKSTLTLDFWCTTEGCP